MGIFADRCQALIDPKTGRALTGEELQAARQDRKWPRCRNVVRKAARFCNKCGSPAPRGWWRCPACGKWVGNESNFCWNCNTPLHPETRVDIAGGVWHKTPGLFAQRFEVGDIKALLKEGLQIQAGTAAILLDSGKFKDVIGPGRHNVDSLARKINFWGDPPPRTVILVDDGDVIVPVRLEGLRSSQEIPVEFYGEIILHFNAKGGEGFVANLLKEDKELRYEEISDLLLGEIRHAVEDTCNTSTIEDLVKDPLRRLRLEDKLRGTLEAALKRCGLDIVRVSSAEFTGKEYEELREKEGQLEIRRREFEFAARLREMVAQDKMEAFKTQTDLEEYVAQLAHEKAVSDETRNHALAVLQLLHRQEISAKAAEFNFAQELAQAAHDIGLKELADEHARKSDLLKAQTEVEITTMWQKVRAEKLRMKREHTAEMARIYAGKDIQTLIALLPEEKHASLLKLNEQLLKQGRSAEEILALSASESPQLAQAIADMERGRKEDRDREWEERKRLLEDMAERLERIMTKALETTADAAKGGGSHTTINK